METRAALSRSFLAFWGLNLGALSFTAVLVFVGSSAGAAPVAVPGSS